MFPPMEYRLMPFKLPMIQYSMDASCFSGSARSFRQTNAVCARLCTAMPERMMLLPFFSAVREESASARSTQQMAPAKADRVTATAPGKNRMPKAAPTLAPEDAPIMSGEARGLRKTV